MRITAADLKRLVFVAEPRLSPRGDAAVATVTRILEGDGDDPPCYRTRIHRFDLATQTGTALTTGQHSDSYPRFDPSGSKLAFLRTRDEEPAQLFVMPLDGGEAMQATTRDAGVNHFAWHPDGDRIAFVSSQRRVRPHEGGSPLRVTRSRHQLEGTGLLTEVPSELLLLSTASVIADGSAGRDGPAMLIELPFAPSQIAFSNDGSTLFALAPTSDDEHAELTSNLLAIPLDRPELHSTLPEAMHIGTFVVAPENDELWFLAPADARAASAPAGLWRVAAPGAAPELVSGDLDVAPSVGGDSRFGTLPAAPIRSEDDWIVSLNASGRSNLAALSTAGSPRYLTRGDRVVTAFDGASDLIVFVAETANRPGELFVRYQDGSELRLTSFNDELCEQRSFATPTGPIALASGDTELAYWRLEPTEPRADGAMVVQVHGGPAANYGYGFMFEFQLLAAAGYTVVYGNPRGGSSFGLDFATAIQGRYGTIDADDIMAIVEHAAAEHPVPNAPIHLTGGSYGGFMTNWLVGRTHRFRSAVTQRSIANFVSFYGTSDIGPWFTEREIGGTPWRDVTKLWDQSPLRNVAEIRTPLLILHAENDRRCPIEQAEQLYAALKRVGRTPTELVRFPGEGHELSRSGRPDRRIARLQAILDWFARHA